MIKNQNIEGFAQNIGKSLSSLANNAIVAYTPLVDEIIKYKITDGQQIEHLLDNILGFCFDGRMLLLYRKLCRYYYDINPQATIDYINFYREMYDDTFDKPMSDSENL